MTARSGPQFGTVPRERTRTRTIREIIEQEIEPENRFPVPDRPRAPKVKPRHSAPITRQIELEVRRPARDARGAPGASAAPSLPARAAPATPTPRRCIPAPNISFPSDIPDLSFHAPGPSNASRLRTPSPPPSPVSHVPRSYVPTHCGQPLATSSPVHGQTPSGGWQSPDVSQISPPALSGFGLPQATSSPIHLPPQDQGFADISAIPTYSPQTPLDSPYFGQPQATSSPVAMQRKLDGLQSRLERLENTLSNEGAVGGEDLRARLQQSQSKVKQGIIRLRQMRF